MLKIKAPGRICLFGEHQDYLNYPVIAMAISKYIYLEAERISEPKFIINLPDMHENLEISLNNKELDYESKRDYIRSGYNQFIRKGIHFKKGYKITITGDIPINAGASSSSALIIAWLFFLNHITGSPIVKKSEFALLGNQAEVGEFNEAGGIMDHYASSYGNILYLEPKKPRPHFIKANPQIDGFILGNSLEDKETVQDLIRVKRLSIEAFEKLNEIMPDFNKFKTSLEDIQTYLPSLEKEYQKKIVGNIINRDITMEAKNLIFNRYPLIGTEITRDNFYQQLGNLLNVHHKELKEKIGISTDKIDQIISNCLESGAFGAKINGSGFGGTMFALTMPGKEDQLIEAINNAGAEPYFITMSKGVDIY